MDIIHSRPQSAPQAIPLEYRETGLLGRSLSTHPLKRYLPSLLLHRHRVALSPPMGVFRPSCLNVRVLDAQFLVLSMAGQASSRSVRPYGCVIRRVVMASPALRASFDKIHAAMTWWTESKVVGWRRTIEPTRLCVFDQTRCWCVWLQCGFESNIARSASLTRLPHRLPGCIMGIRITCSSLLSHTANRTSLPHQWLGT